MRDYQSSFERLLCKAKTQTDKQETTCFISGLREPLQANVRAQNPTTLSSVIFFARIYEGKNQEGKKGPSEYRPNSFVKRSPTQGARVSKGDDKGNNKLEFPVR